MKNLTSIFLTFLFLFHSIVLGVDGRPHEFFTRFLNGEETKQASGNHTYIYSYVDDLPYTVKGVSAYNAGQLKFSTYKEFDKLNRLKEFSVLDASNEILQKESYLFNDLNQREKLTLKDGSSWLYSYDEKGNLVSAVKKDADGNAVPEYNFSYSFDAMGNRLTANEGAVSTSYTANSLNQYTSVNVNSLITESTYDAEGNITFDGQWHYIWDAENRLALMFDKDKTKLIENVYGSNDFRIAKKVWNLLSGWTAPTKLTEFNSNALTPLSQIGFIYEGKLVSAEIDLLNGNSLIRSYTWGLDISSSGSLGGAGGLLAIEDNNNTYYTVHNTQGSISKLLSSVDSSVVSSYEYAPNGNLLSFSEGIFNPFRFNTKYLDEETGLYYYGYRFYNPTTGRWLNQDPLGINGGLNLYSANGNDGINNIDPYGLSVYKTLDSFWDWGGDAINYLATGGNPSDENLMLLDKYVYSNKVVAAYADLGDGIRQVASLMDCVFPADLLKSFGMGLVKELAFVIGAAGAAALLGGPVVAVAGVALVGWAAKQFWDQREQISEYAGKIFGSDCQCWSIRERRQLSKAIGGVFAGLAISAVMASAGTRTIMKSMSKIDNMMVKVGKDKVPKPNKPNFNNPEMNEARRLAGNHPENSSKLNDDLQVVNVQNNDETVRRSIDALEHTGIIPSDHLALVAHGSSNDLGGLSPKQLYNNTKELVNNPQIKQIDLISCETGAGNFAQNYANLVNKPVLAPIRNVNVLQGIYGIPQVRDACGNLMAPGEGFKLFKPQGLIKRLKTRFFGS